MKKLVKYLGGSLATGLLPLVALAQDIELTKDTILSLLEEITTWFAAIILALSILIILYAAFLYLTAAGDEEKLGKAKRTFIYALVGIGLAIIAFGVRGLVASFLGG